jgi:hypothetical protein
MVAWAVTRAVEWAASWAVEFDQEHHLREVTAISVTFNLTPSLTVTLTLAPS